MIIFKRYGKTVKISNRHWRSLRKRLNPDRAEWGNGYYRIWSPCLLCREHTACDTCGLGVFDLSKGEGPSGCFMFLKMLFRGKPAFNSENTDLIKWSKRNNDLARIQLKRIQKLMDEVEKEQ